MARVGLALAIVAIACASPAAAVFDPALEAPETNGQPELVMTGTGPGRGSIRGALAPSQFDPLTGYPAAPPAGSVPKNVGFAGLITAAPIPPGPQLLLYCIDITTPTGPGVKYELGTWNESTVPNVGYVARLLTTYYPNTNEPSSLTNPSDKAAAVQAAIWFFSDKYVLEPAQPRRAEVAAIVQNVITLGPLVNPPPPSLTITPTSAEGPAGSTIGPYTVATTSPATVTATGGDLFADASGTVPLTNPVGNGSQFWARRTTPGPIQIQATAVATVPTGNVYLPIGQVAQKLILAQTGTLSTRVDASATAYDVGDLEVIKTVSGPGEPQRSAVSLAVTCTDGSHGAANYPAGSPPTPLLVEDIRAGSVCTVIELVDGANDTVSVTTTFIPGAVVTIPENGTTTDVTTVNVSNVYTVRPGALRVTKVVTGSDVALRGDVVVDVSCSDGTTASFTFPAGTAPTPRTVPDLPAGTTCTTTEPVDGSNPPTVLVSTTIEPSGPVTIVPGETAEVVVSNQYDSGIGSLVVQKDTEGLDQLRDPITIRAECDDGSIGEQTYPVGGTLDPIVLDALPLGTQCTITEPVDGESTLVDVATTILPASTVTITVPQPPVVVRITDTYTAKPGDVTVDKSITGPGAGRHSRVVVVASCEDGQLDRIDLPAGAPGPASVTLSGVPAGDDCGVAELADGSNTTVTATVTGLPEARFVILPAERRTVSITNDYGLNPGSLEVTKTIDGPEVAGRSTSTLTIGCSDGTQVSRTLDPAASPSPIVVDDLPAGTTCRIEEPENGAATGIGVITSGAPRTMTIEAGVASTAVVRNTYVEVADETVQNPDATLPATGGRAPLAALGAVLVATGFAMATRRDSDLRGLLERT